MQAAQPVQILFVQIMLCMYVLQQLVLLLDSMNSNVQKTVYIVQNLLRPQGSACCFINACMGLSCEVSQMLHQTGLRFSDLSSTTNVAIAETCSTPLVQHMQPAYRNIIT